MGGSLEEIAHIAAVQLQEAIQKAASKIEYSHTDAGCEQKFIEFFFLIIQNYIRLIPNLINSALSIVLSSQVFIT